MERGNHKPEKIKDKPQKRTDRSGNDQNQRNAIKSVQAVLILRLFI